MHMHVTNSHSALDHCIELYIDNRYVYLNEMDIRLEYVLMAGTFFKSILSFSLPHPVCDLDYASYQLPVVTGTTLIPGVELFSDSFRCNPTVLLSCLHFCVEELIKRRHSVKVHIPTNDIHETVKTIAKPTSISEHVYGDILYDV